MQLNVAYFHLHSNNHENDTCKKKITHEGYRKTTIIPPFPFMILYHTLNVCFHKITFIFLLLSLSAVFCKLISRIFHQPKHTKHTQKKYVYETEGFLPQITCIVAYERLSFHSWYIFKHYPAVVTWTFLTLQLTHINYFFPNSYSNYDHIRMQWRTIMKLIFKKILHHHNRGKRQICLSFKYVYTNNV